MHFKHPLFYAFIMLKYSKLILLLSFVFLAARCATSNTIVSKQQHLDLPGNIFFASADTVFFSHDFIGVDTLIQKDSKREKSRKKFVSALFAFPFPFGFMGAHRVMLGTKPWVPVVYVVTFGGCFGVIPLIDFFVITFSKDISKYEDNSAIFMWLK
jgi:TM2 domain-containing membrane protein YozV